MTTVRNHPFDAPVKAGELRIFADRPAPLVALVVEDCGLEGYRIVPVSPRATPASPREMLVGERIYQLWNTVIAPRPFVDRSWLVDTLAAEDLADIRHSIAAALPGRLTEGDGEQAHYERANLLDVDALSPQLVASGSPVDAASSPRRAAPASPVDAASSPRRAAPASPVDAASSPRRHPSLFRYSAWSAAAMFLVCAGAAWFVFQDAVLTPSPEQPLVAPVPTVPMIGAKSAREDVAERRLRAEQRMREARGAKCASAARCASKMRMRSMCVDASESAADGWETESAPAPVGLLCAGPSPYDRAGTSRYAGKGENPFTDPREVPLSTFGLDVDTTSYALMRTWLQDRHRLPPAESVRIEEYVNYFKFDYPEPTDETPVAVAAEYAACPWNKTHRILRLGLKAKDLVKAAAKRGDRLPPCNLTFLIDISGSMWGENRLGLAQKGLKMLVGKMREEDHIAIVTYASGTDVRLPATSGADKARIASAIDELRAGGCTAGGAGLELAYAEAQKNFDRKANNRVILVTDGDFNVGVSGPDGLEKLIETKRASGIFLSVFGVGEGNYQDAAMKKLANAGNGNYAFMDSLLEAKKVFSDAFAGTLYTVAKDVKLQVEFNPSEVAQYRLLGYENRALAAKDFNDDRKDAGEMGSGHTMTAFYEIVPPGAVKEPGVDPLKYQPAKNAKPAPVAASNGELCTVKLRWKAPDGDVSSRRDLPLRASDIARGNPSEDFRFASAVAEFALILKNSQYRGDAKLDEVLTRARGAKGADADGCRAEFIRLVERAQLLSVEPLCPAGE